MILMYADPAATAAMSVSERAEVARRHEALHQDLAGTGEMLNGAGLAYPKDTTTIRWRADGSTSVEGPLTGVTEQLTAYYVVDCASPERAHEIANRIHDSFGMGDA